MLENPSATILPIAETAGAERTARNPKILIGQPDLY